MQRELLALIRQANRAQNGSRGPVDRHRICRSVGFSFAPAVPYLRERYGGWGATSAAPMPQDVFASRLSRRPLTSTRRTSAAYRGTTMAQQDHDIDPFKVSSPRIFLVRMMLFLVLGALLVVILDKQIWAAFLANPGLNGLIVVVLLIGIVFAFRQVLRLFPEV